MVVVKRDLERTASKADTLEERVKVLEETVANSADSVKELEEREGESSMEEERVAEELVLLEGQFKDAEVRNDAAERSCKLMERQIAEIEVEIKNWRQDASKIRDERDEIFVMQTYGETDRGD